MRNMNKCTWTYLSASIRRFFRLGLAAGALSLLSAESSLESARARFSASTPPVLALAVKRPPRRGPFELLLLRYGRACNCWRSGGGGVSRLEGLRTRGLLMSAADRFDGRGTGAGAGCGSNVMAATIAILGVR